MKVFDEIYGDIFISQEKEIISKEFSRFLENNKKSSNTEAEVDNGGDILPDNYSNALSSNRNNKASEKILIKEQNEKTKDTTTKTLGRKTKGSTEKGKHGSNSDDNQRDKRIRSLVA